MRPDKLQRFREAAERNHTDALVVVKDGRVVLRYQRPGTAARFEASKLLSGVVREVAGHELPDFARAGPGVTADDLAKIGEKIGELVLKHGAWRGRYFDRQGFFVRSAGVSSIRADGGRGQFLLVYPESRLVVVRLRHPPDPGQHDPARNDAGAFEDLEREIDALREAL